MAKASAVATSSLLLLGACAPLVETPDGRRLRAGSEEFRDYATAVFRRHNAAAIALGDALVSGRLPPRTDIDTLDDAEARMLNACEPLDRLAIARRDNKKLDLQQLEQIADAVPACDRTTRALEVLLDPGSR